MLPSKHRHENQIDHFRRRMQFTPLQVAQLLGHKDASSVSDYQRGERLPSLVNALRLAIILRVPAEFLFPALFERLRTEIRAAEERLAQPVQPTLF